MFEEDMLVGLFVIGFPVIFGYLIPTVPDYFIKHNHSFRSCENF